MDQKLLRKHVIDLVRYFEKEPEKLMLDVDGRDYQHIFKGLKKLVKANKERTDFTGLTDGLTTLQYKNEVGLLAVIADKLENAKIKENISYREVTDILRTYSVLLGGKNKIDLD